MLKRILQNKKLMLVLAIAWTLLIFIGCSLPGKDLPPVDVFDHFDKVIHFTFFFFFAILWLLAFPPLASNRWNFGIVIITLSFLYGFGLEFYQINFVSGRSWDVWDGVADGIGGVVGVIAYRYLLLNYISNNQ